MRQIVTIPPVRARNTHAGDSFRTRSPGTQTFARDDGARSKELNSVICIGVAQCTRAHLVVKRSPSS
jgi:hypothetical protein